MRFHCLTAALLLTVSAFASHHVRCTVEVQIEKITRIPIDRWNGVVVYSGIPTVSEQIDNYVEFKVLKVADEDGVTEPCKFDQNKVYVAMVRSDGNNQYLQNQRLTLQYTNVGTHNFRRVQWTVSGK